MQNIFTELRSQYEYLSRVEKKLADLVLEDPKRFIACSMEEIAQEASVSQGSVNNFSKKFSSGGFSALKLRVAACLSEHRPMPEEQGKKESIHSVMEKKLETTLQAFRNTLELNDEQVLKAAAERVMKAKKIEIYGVYHSGIVARDFCFQLIRLGIPATYLSDTLMCAASASMLDEHGLVIAISSSGLTKELLEVAEITKANGAQLIAITTNRFSPLAKMADSTLLSAHSGASVGECWEESRMTQLLLLDTLCSYISERVEMGDREHLHKLRKVLAMHNVSEELK